MDEKEIRLECLRLAAGQHGPDSNATVEAATRYWQFVENPSQAKPAHCAFIDLLSDELAQETQLQPLEASAQPVG